MQSADIIKTVPIIRSSRVMQIEGMFDLTVESVCKANWTVSLPLDERLWNIGLIVGPSGSGKTTIAEELFGLTHVSKYSKTQSIVDSFPKKEKIKEIVALLSSVGFSSPPSWLKPYHVLSTGERFRVDCARVLAERRAISVIDEFTSVVDRTVAKIGSAAVAKVVRKREQKFIAVTCHYDVLDWLQPDWTYDTGTQNFRWRCLQRRPPIKVDITRVHRSVWKLFRQHHYLSHELHRGSSCFLGSIEEQPAVMTAVLAFPHPVRPGWREHRTVCLPDFQGVGIGNAMSEYVASLYRTGGKPYFSTTSHPGMILHRKNSSKWRMLRAPSLVKEHSVKKHHGMIASSRRRTAGFEFIGPKNRKDAIGFDVLRTSRQSE